MVSTSHALARELLKKPDGFLVAMLGGEEYIVSSIKTAYSDANIDDSVAYIILNLCKCGKGNMKT